MSSVFIFPNLVIDNKENPQFISVVKSLFDPVSIEIRPLELGDIAFYYPSLEGNLLLLIERKTLPDLASSLADGRYKEQKARLIALNRGQPPVRVIYLLEGEYSQLSVSQQQRMKSDAYRGIIINTMVRDMIPIYQTRNMEESARFILAIRHHMPKYIQEIATATTNPNTEAGYATVIKSKKKDNLTPQVCYWNALKQIPGLSQSMAEQITAVYPSIQNLIEAYQGKKTEKEKIQLLRDIQLSGTRRLGPVVSERVYRYLCCVPPLEK